MVTKVGDARVETKLQRKCEEAWQTLSQRRDCFGVCFGRWLRGGVLGVSAVLRRIRSRPPHAAYHVELFRACSQLVAHGYVLRSAAEMASAGDFEVIGMGNRTALTYVAVDNMRSPFLVMCGRSS